MLHPLVNTVLYKSLPTAPNFLYQETDTFCLGQNNFIKRTFIGKVFSA